MKVTFDNGDAFSVIDKARAYAPLWSKGAHKLERIERCLVYSCECANCVGFWSACSNAAMQQKRRLMLGRDLASQDSPKGEQP